MRAETAQCPTCGAGLPASGGVVRCSYCRQEVRVSPDPEPITWGLPLFEGGAVSGVDCAEEEEETPYFDFDSVCLLLGVGLCLSTLVAGTWGFILAAKVVLSSLV